MGLFDDVTVRYKLPGMPMEPPYQMQTKSLRCGMDQYTLMEDGSLILHYREYEATPKEELEFPDQPYIGCMRIAKGSEKDIKVNHHGRMRIYNMFDDVWHEYELKFDDGKLVDVLPKKIDDPDDECTDCGCS